MLQFGVVAFNLLSYGHDIYVELCFTFAKQLINKLCNSNVTYT